MCKLKYICWFSVLFLFFLFNKIGSAQGTINIVDYFLKDPGAWEHTKRIIHKNPTKVMVENSKDLVFNLTELTYGDEVALIFLDTKKAEKFKHAGLCNAEDKIVPGINRIVSVTTKNAGNRTQFYYKFLLQRNINNVPVTIFNNGNAVLESKYDGSQPVKDISNLSGIELCELEVR